MESSFKFDDFLKLVPVIALFVGMGFGGLAGAVLTNIVTVYRSKRQPINYSIDILKIFHKSPNLSSLGFYITHLVSDEPKPNVQVNNLSIARIYLVNKSNKDLTTFTFGVTFNKESQAISFQTSTPDRHHIIEASKEVDILSSTNEIDFTLKPFHRGEVYSIDIPFIYETSPGSIELSTSEPIKLIKIGSVSEATLGIMNKIGFAIIENLIK